MLKFSIRDVLWLMIVVGLALGWWIHQGRVAAEIASLNEKNFALQSQADDINHFLSCCEIMLHGEGFVVQEFDLHDCDVISPAGKRWNWNPVYFNDGRRSFAITTLPKNE